MQTVNSTQNFTSSNVTSNISDIAETTNVTTTTILTTIKTTTTVSEEKQFLDYSEDYPAKEVEPCYFIEDIVNPSMDTLSKRSIQNITSSDVTSNISDTTETSNQTTTTSTQIKALRVDILSKRCQRSISGKVKIDFFNFTRTLYLAVLQKRQLL